LPDVDLPIVQAPLGGTGDRTRAVCGAGAFARTGGKAAPGPAFARRLGTKRAYLVEAQAVGFTVRQ